MSGSIHFGPDRHWFAAGWCFRAVLAEVILELREHHPPGPLLAELSDPEGVPQIVEFIEVHEMPAERQRLFAQTACDAYQRCRRAGFSQEFPTATQAVLLSALRDLVWEARDLLDRPSPFDAEG